MKMRIPVSTLPRGVPGFVRWLRATNPVVYGELAARLSDRLGDLGINAPAAASTVETAAEKPGIASTILSTVKELVSVGLPLYQQNKLFELQIKRAQAGLAPLDTQAISDASAIRVGVDSQTRNTGLLIAGGLAAAVVLFAILKR